MKSVPDWLQIYPLGARFRVVQFGDNRDIAREYGSNTPQMYDFQARVWLSSGTLGCSTEKDETWQTHHLEAMMMDGTARI